MVNAKHRMSLCVCSNAIGVGVPLAAIPKEDAIQLHTAGQCPA